MLRDMQFCNLTEVVVRPEDDLDSLLDKVECATWLGVIQSTFTTFPYLRKEWKKNCDVERLLGVSLTGQMDNLAVLNSEALKALKSRVLRISRKASTLLGVNMPAATTCVKPSGTVSQLVDSASGVHPRWSDYYIRRYRIAARDPLFKMLKKQGFAPKRIITDKLKSYVVAIRKERLSAVHDQGLRANNRAGMTRVRFATNRSPGRKKRPISRKTAWVISPSTRSLASVRAWQKASASRLSSRSASRGDVDQTIEQRPSSIGRSASGPVSMKRCRATPP